MRRWMWMVAMVGCGLVAGCQDSAKDGGGFAGDTRPTFAAGDPYEDVILLDWQPWSDDLFGRTSSSTPILLHLGAHWCHLCHVYDRGVYGEPNFAALIEENFVLVRVDPDERPDINYRYMQGDWPTVCVLTPEGDLVTGTRFAPDELERFLRASLATYVTGGDSLRTALAREREAAARSQPFQKETGILEPTVRQRVFEGIKAHLDTDYGGFRPRGEAGSKIVSAEILYVLLLELASNPGLDDELLAFAEHTLDMMMNSAVRDHLHGGFFRSVDDRAWSRPRFGKMLEVQANVAELYMLGATVFDRDDFRDVALETIDFVFETFSNPDSLTFANAIDPDLGPFDDGTFYTWTVAQVDSLLVPGEAEAVKLMYGIAPSGEMPREAENTLYEAYDVAEAAARMNLGANEFSGLVENGLARMRAFRRAGPRPRIDSRAYARPNLAFARALLGAASVFDAPEYRSRALRLIDFFTATHRAETGGVPHYFDGESVGDLALFANQVSALSALIRAFEVTGDESYLERSRALVDHVSDAYTNEATGACWDVPTYATGPGFLQLKLRPIRHNVRYASALMDLAILVGDGSYERAAHDILLAFSQSFGASGLVSIDYSIETHRLLTNQSTSAGS